MYGPLISDLFPGATFHRPYSIHEYISSATFFPCEQPVTLLLIQMSMLRDMCYPWGANVTFSPRAVPFQSLTHVHSDVILFPHVFVFCSGALLLLTIMYRCGEDCDRTFSSSWGLNQHCSSCLMYKASHAWVLARVSTTLCVPEKHSRSGSEVSLHWQSLCYPSLISSALQVRNPAWPALHPCVDQYLSAEPIMVSASQVYGFLPISWALLNTKDRRLLWTQAHIAHTPCAKPLT